MPFRAVTGGCEWPQTRCAPLRNIAVHCGLSRPRPEITNKVGRSNS
jgi:hypothetical protein